MRYNAIIVAGGRGSRLGGTDKPLLHHAGATLLDHALRSTTDAERVAVVGPTELNPVVSRYAAGADPGQIITLTREYPAFAGPAAAVAAGLRALLDGADDEVPLTGAQAPLTLILAADLIDPGPAAAGIVRVAASAHAAQATGAADAGGQHMPGPAPGLPDGDFGRAWVPVDAAGRLQPLSCVVETAALAWAIEAAEKPGEGLANSSMMRLLAKVQIVRVSLEGVEYVDVDTWEDAERAGIRRPPAQGHTG